MFAAAPWWRGAMSSHVAVLNSLHPGRRGSPRAISATINSAGMRVSCNAECNAPPLGHAGLVSVFVIFVIFVYCEKGAFPYGLIADLIFSNRISRFLFVIGRLSFVILPHESSLSLLG
jgi:hypothetical protein